jgi:Galactose oxidase, central domain
MTLRFATVVTAVCVLMLLWSTASPAYGTVTWVQIPTPNSPPARAAAAMAYDPVSRKVVLFGGYDASQYLQDTWTFDGTTWTQVSGRMPAARAASILVYDSVTRQLLLFGGFSGKYLNDTWIWNGATSKWTRAHTGHALPAVTGAMGFSDPISGHADILGGWDGMFYHNETYQWTGTTWQELPTPTRPFARGAAIASLDPARHIAVLFGGLGDLNTNNTWTFDGSTWTLQNPLVQPLIHYYGNSAYDPRLGGVIGFGGADGGPDFNDTWKWDGSNWVHLDPIALPTPRESFGMTYDDAIHRVIIFGGQTNVNGGFELLNDTWKLIP